MHVIKTIKFDLSIDGVKVKNLEELRDHFTAEIIEHYQSGILAKWLKSRNLMEELAALETLYVYSTSSFTLMKRLCEVFKVDADDMIITAALGMPPEKMEKNFPEIKQQYRTLAYEEAKATWLAEEEKKPIMMEHYLVYRNGIVQDTRTNLMWKQKPEGEYKWGAAMKKFGSNVSFAGYNDWRMPTIDELKTLLSEKDSKELKVFFGWSETFWSSSPVADNSSNAWHVNFSNGHYYNWYSKSNAYQVRLVRSGQ